ncbi:hypothetical protein D9619_012120 [Psilocybe cf. subviscida]|uniref:Uncharacterized protein n=1 Tax=Psilocybe cf. subviscida TaxID=2480587 RepID=A0A8H5B7K5_9AGAR|nr:hypothetical protein D9619_012120 [Psilocybe cf. subviscida]
MPKASGSSSVRSTPNSSPRKAPRKKALSNPTEIDKSQWRTSKIPVGTTINKSAATSNYHLNVKNLEGLKFERTETVIHDVVRPMFLYQERDVEYRAWEKYGNPEAFDQMISTKGAKYYEKHGRNAKKPFPQPSSYTQPAIMIVPASMFRDAAERYYDASTPKLLAMKQKLQREDKEWLWKAIVDAYQRQDGRPGKLEQEWVILSAQEYFVSRYPRRTQDDPALSNSASFAALRDVLSRAPVWNEERDRYKEAHQDFEMTHITFLDMIDIPDWTRTYCNKVYDALSGIIAEHGARGWKQARWMVYDRYAECNLGCVEYEKIRGDYVWGDEGIVWLEASEYEKMDEDKKAAFLRSSPKQSRNSSPRMARSRAESKATEDPSAWRGSWIREGTTINKTSALANYRLKEDKISDLTPTTAVGLYGPMYLYDERAVEQKAWETCGGPIAFETMLRKKFTIWRSKSRKWDFPVPLSYATLILGGQSTPHHNVSTSPARVRANPTPSASSRFKQDWDTPTPAIAAIKNIFVGRGQKWLWDRIFMAYLGIETEDYIGNGRKDRNAMEDFFRAAQDEPKKSYPPRPNEEDSASMMAADSFETLTRRLGRAAVWDKGEDRQDGLTVDAGCYPHWICSADCVKPYYESIHGALVGIIREHGRPRWMVARWLVYDQYVKCNLGGVEYDEESGDWSDNGAFWFEPKRYRKMSADQKQSFCAALEIDIFRDITADYTYRQYVKPQANIKRHAWLMHGALSRIVPASCSSGRRRLGAWATTSSRSEPGGWLRPILSWETVPRTLSLTSPQMRNTVMRLVPSRLALRYLVHDLLKADGVSRSCAYGRLQSFLDFL